MAVNLSFVENDEELGGKDPPRSMAFQGTPKSLSERPNSLTFDPVSSSHSDQRREGSDNSKICHNDVEVANQSNAPKTISLESRLHSNLPTSASSSGRIRRRGLVGRDVDYKSVLRQKFENSEVSHSDSEVSVRSAKNHRLRSSPTPRCGIENRQPCEKTLKKSDIFANGHAVCLPCERPVPSITGCSGQPCAVITNPYSEGRYSEHSSSVSKSTDSSQPSKSRKEFLSLPDTLESVSAEEKKRPKSYFNISPKILRKSPAAIRRKNPYSELVVRRIHSDKETTSTSKTFPPTNRLSDPIDRSWSDFVRSQPRTARSARRSIAGDFPHLMMTAKFPYTSHYQDSERGRDNDRSKGRDVETDSSSKRYDAVVFDMLKVPPDEFAKQLTLLDLPVFKAINPDELTGCGWSKKDKWKLSPNVCAMTQRFNNTSFWVIREILNAATLKIRAEILTHCIKIAKKLYELNNLHSLMAVIQSLNSSSIIRLSKTWALITRSHKSSFDRLLILVKEDENRAELRAHMEDIKLPCIPFLGIYLSDVMFINSAYPPTEGIETHERRDKINNILRVISEFQQSKYEHLQEKSHILNYLKSVKYIEELEKFVEEDNYKLSLKIEPPPPSIHTSDHKDDPHSSKLGKKTEKQGSSSRTPQTPPKFFPGHRKSKSLGKEFSFDPNSSSNLNNDDDSILKGGSLPRTGLPGVTTSLLDDSVINVAPGSASSGFVSQINQKTGTSESVATSYSNSGSDQSDESVWLSKLTLAKFQLLSKKSRSPLQWFMSNTSYRRDKCKPQRSTKSSTYPFDKKSPASSVYQSYLSTNTTNGIWNLHESVRSSLSIEMDEFIDMRIRQTSDSDDSWTHFEYADEGTTLLSSSESQTATKIASKTSFGPSNILDRARESVSNISLKLSDQKRTWMEYVASSKDERRLCRSRSESEAMFVVSCSDAVDSTASKQSDADRVKNEKPVCKFEGCLRRKCMLKKGRKPTMSTWTRYWLRLYDDTTLVYFPAKGMKMTERSHFKSHPCKVVPVLGWMLLRLNDANKQDSFQLSNPENGTIYRFQCDSAQIAAKWMSIIEETIKGHSPPERDLINLDDS